MERWTPRTVLRLGQWSSGAVPLKAYAIQARGGEPLEPIALEAAARIVSAASDAIATTRHEGCGFAILHRDEAYWLQLIWWMEGSSCAQLLWRSPVDAPEDFGAVERPAMACVWELALIDHERRAFIRSNSLPGDAVAAYLKDVFPQDFC